MWQPAPIMADSGRSTWDSIFNRLRGWAHTDFRSATEFSAASADQTTQSSKQLEDVEPGLSITEMISPV
jgi:hypothetical protein